MWNKLPLCAAVLVLCACSSAPEIQYPKGKGSRAQINVDSMPSSLAIRASSIGSDKPLSDVPTSLAVQLFFVNSNETTTISVLHRWATVAKVGFTWTGDVDYSVTDQMRRIQAPTVELAVAAMVVALRGVKPPVTLTIGQKGMTVSTAADIPEATAAVPVSVARPRAPAPQPATMVATVTPAAPSRPGGNAPVLSAPFSVLPSDKLLIPLFVRWAHADGSLVVLNGHRVTQESLNTVEYFDLPLTSSARQVAATTPIEAVNKVLAGYKSFGFKFDIKASMHGEKLLSITTDDKPVSLNSTRSR